MRPIRIVFSPPGSAADFFEDACSVRPHPEASNRISRRQNKITRFLINPLDILIEKGCSVNEKNASGWTTNAHTEPRRVWSPGAVQGRFHFWSDRLLTPLG